MSKLLFAMLGAVAEFERAIIRERQKEGIFLAKQAGAYKGRKPFLSNEQLNLIKVRIANRDKKSHIAKDLNISRETLYAYLEKLKVQ